VLVATTHLPLWASTPWLGGLFVASGASTGLAAIALGLMLTRAPVTSEAWLRLQRMDTVALLVELVLLVAFVGTLALQGYGWSLGLVVLLGLTLVVGLVGPLVMLLRGTGRAHPALRVAALAAVFILLGGFALRLAIVMGGQGLL
jgi:hypothetical protein